LGPIAEGKYIIILVETHEHDGCKVPDFEGYKKTSVWNKGNETGKGHGGVTVLINEKWGGVVKVVKEDPNKQYIWLQITEKEVTFRLVACYFSPKNSKIYKRSNLDNEDPYASLKRDISLFNHLGEVMLMGDFNARTTNNQSLQLSNEERGENNPLWLEESGDQSWARDSQDGNGGVTHFGAELLGLCSLFGMVICNGMRGWPASGGITCKTYNGQSVVDYLICSQSFTSRVLKFDIGDCPIEMKSDHAPLLVKLDFPC
jgi:exonuclease III